MENSITNSFKQAIINPLSDNLVNITEFSIDLLIKNDALKDFPIIGQLLGLYKTGIGIKEFFTVRKIFEFLTKLQDVSPEEKEVFLNKLSKNENYKNDIFEKLLIVLDRFDDTEKAKILGNLFKNCLEGKITISNFFHLASILDRGYFNYLKSFCMSEGLNNEVKKNLAGLGLLQEKIEMELKPDRITSLNMPDFKFHYRITTIGSLLRQFAYNEEEKEKYYLARW